MGHLVGKDIYKQLGDKIDKQMIRAPYNDTLYEILKELYTEEEANTVVNMPLSLSTAKKISSILKMNELKLIPVLEKLCQKGLVIDLKLKGKYYYTPSPFVIGIFEFTMMRLDKNVNLKKMSGLFHEYFESNEFIYSNFGNKQRISIVRALPYEQTVSKEDVCEILDFEKAEKIIDYHNTFAIGICSCRHQELHLGTKECNVPLEMCSSFGVGAQYLIRNNLGKEVSKEEMMANITKAKELGLILSADNVKQTAGFICCCCGCCCHLLSGIKKYGYPGIVVTSNFIAKVNKNDCSGCGLCEKACPIDVIKMEKDDKINNKKKQFSKIDETLCLGCGVCALKCKKGYLKLQKRKSRVLYPETFFERLFLQSLERDVLQYYIFDNPESSTQKVLRYFVGGFLKLPPVKKAMMSDSFRSRFLTSIRERVSKKGIIPM